MSRTGHSSDSLLLMMQSSDHYIRNTHLKNAGNYSYSLEVSSICHKLFWFFVFFKSQLLALLLLLASSSCEKTFHPQQLSCLSFQLFFFFFTPQTSVDHILCYTRLIISQLMIVESYLHWDSVSNLFFFPTTKQL